ncbi:coproporphyrinogen-III oxidase family protein [Candidatus Eisenbacteria bacterium]|uniref:Coproporphyrinogen-III oxidase family protein n=1 Tax=Eiseniibacteriota bacterium TaxID=2212470 RepID=A0ABV6YIT0_UNCEI
MLGNLVRRCLCKTLAGEKEIALENRIPSAEELVSRCKDVEELGIYLHIPFCRQICPYCPYNRELYEPELAARYTAAVKKEIAFYSGVVGSRPVTSLYIGGGTPTTMLDGGLADILGCIHDAFDVRCGVHMESHPNDLSDRNLDRIRSMGVQHLSTGVEALQDRHLRNLSRPYTVESVKEAVARALSKGFKCVNVDVMFALPGQTCREVAQTGMDLVEMGVGQVAAYPLFSFPYSRMGSPGQDRNFSLGRIFKRRKMLKILEKIFYGAGFKRTSVWAFTRSGLPRYCSVTVPLYIGLGASGGTYLRDVFYLNTFSAAEYVKAFENGGTAVALSLDLSESMQMAGWLYWRVYETRFRRSDFRKRFGKDFDAVYGRYIKPLKLFGFLADDGEEIVFTDRGTYWIHALEDLFSIESISRLWGTSNQEAWPETVVL